MKCQSGYADYGVKPFIIMDIKLYILMKNMVF